MYLAVYTYRYITMIVITEIDSLVLYKTQNTLEKFRREKQNAELREKDKLEN